MILSATSSASSTVTWKELLFAVVSFGVIRSIITFLFLALIAVLLFAFNIFDAGAIAIALYALGLLVFGWVIGIFVSVIIGLIVGANWYTDPNSYMAALLAILGFIVGLLSFFAMGSITHDKVPTFLIAALTLVGIGALSTRE